MLSLGRDVAAKRALADFALAELYRGDLARLTDAWHARAPTVEDLYRSHPEPPAADLSRLRSFFADHYYDFIYRTVKQIDPNHLYFGFWIYRRRCAERFDSAGQSA